MFFLFEKRYKKKVLHRLTIDSLSPSSCHARCCTIFYLNGDMIEKKEDIFQVNENERIVTTKATKANVRAIIYVNMIDIKHPQ